MRLEIPAIFGAGKGSQTETNVADHGALHSVHFAQPSKYLEPPSHQQTLHEVEHVDLPAFGGRC